MKLAQTAALALALSAASCTSTTHPTAGIPEFDWVRPVNSPEVMFAKARQLALEVGRQPECYAALSALPDWPPGPVVVDKFVTSWPDGNRQLLAQTLWRHARDGHPAIEPLVQVHTDVLETRAVEFLALVLIHELVHAASWSDFEGYALDDPERKKIEEDNEQRAREITGICSRAARFAS